MSTKKVFVTVGTTKFQKLIDAITTREVLGTLSTLGYNFVQLQTGSEFSEAKIDPTIELLQKIQLKGSSTIIELGNEMTLKFDQYFENFVQEIETSDLIISHAGAGTCLEVLSKQKLLIIVINEDLMGNHQTELAEELENNGYVYHCTCNKLEHTLKRDFTKLKRYPKPKDNLFSRYLNKCVGFV